MSEVWLTIGVLAVTTALIRASGPLAVGGRALPDRMGSVIALLAPALLAALVVVETVGSAGGGELELDERILGVAAAGGILIVGGTTLPAVLVGAAVAAAARALL